MVCAGEAGRRRRGWPHFTWLDCIMTEPRSFLFPRIATSHPRIAESRLQGIVDFAHARTEENLYARPRTIDRARPTTHGRLHAITIYISRPTGGKHFISIILSP